MLGSLRIALPGLDSLRNRIATNRSGLLAFFVRIAYDARATYGEEEQCGEESL